MVAALIAAGAQELVNQIAICRMDLDPVKNPEFFATESRAGTFIGVASLLLTATVVVVGLRFYTRKIILNRLMNSSAICILLAFFHMLLLHRI